MIIDERNLHQKMISLSYIAAGENHVSLYIILSKENLLQKGQGMNISENWKKKANID